MGFKFPIIGFKNIDVEWSSTAEAIRNLSARKILMKHYPTQIWLSVNNPATGKSEMRWFPVNNEQHEKFVRSQIANAKDTIATARKRMAEAIGADPQKMIVENLQKEFIEFHSREAAHGLDAKGSAAGEASGDQG